MLGLRPYSEVNVRLIADQIRRLVHQKMQNFLKDSLIINNTG